MKVELGDTIPLKGQNWRVVRIIDHSLTLIEFEGKNFVVDEVYIELKGNDGSIDFIQVDKEQRPYEGQPSVIRALEPVNYIRPKLSEVQPEAISNDRDPLE